MKKLLFILSFTLISVFAFANTSHSNTNNVQTANKVNINTEVVISLNNHQKIKGVGGDCTIKADVKVTKNGKTTTVKGTITVVGKSCMDLIKGALK